MFEMNVSGITNAMQTYDYRYLFSHLIGPSQLELLIFTIGMSFFAIFVWFFYKNISKRDIFKLDVTKYKESLTEEEKFKKIAVEFFYILKYGVIFPFYVFSWFVILSIFLFILAEGVTVRQIALISIIFVSTVRITSYLKEELSLELAKLVPFALLAIFLIEPNFFSWDLFITRLEALPSLGLELLQFLTFAILLEWFLRILYSIKVFASCKISKESQ